MRKDKTNWNNYYEHNKSIFSVFAQSIQRKYVISNLLRYCNQEGLRVVELGGANSCLFEPLYESLKCIEYKVVDNSISGLDKFKTKYNGTECKIVIENQNLLDNLSIDDNYDLSCSLGLIEHFDSVGTKDIIQSHFKYVRSGGYVLISFPTPTFQYRFIRFIMEKLGVWQFWDERPLHTAEVEPIFEEYGTIRYKILMRKMPLTQMLYIIQKKASI